jgi:CRISPR system Cascade subunit CasB
MTTPNSPEHPALITYLLRLAANDDRAAFAQLRRGLGKPPGTDIGSFPHVVPYIPEADSGVVRSWPYFVVASLFASHPQQGPDKKSVAAAIRELKDSPSRDGRFRALLNAHVDEVADHLRHAVSQLSSHGIVFDWATLLRDLKSWGHPEQFVQRNWARDFWAEG